MLQFQEARHLLMVWNKDALGGFLQKINRLGGGRLLRNGFRLKLFSFHVLTFFVPMFTYVSNREYLLNLVVKGSHNHNLFYFYRRFNGCYNK